MLAMLMAPARKYSQWLERKPMLTKCLTSGVMYALGDICAQRAQHYTENKQHEEEQIAAATAADVAEVGAAGGASALQTAADTHHAQAHPPKRFRVDWTRAGIFFVFGTVVGGPAYAYWFGWLDTLPATLFKMRQLKQRGEILRAYNLLKRNGIEVNLRVDKLPSAKPLGVWTEKAFKIAADQFIFSSLYTLVFFVGIGMMKGGVDKLLADKRMEDLQAWEDELHAKFGGHTAAAAAALASVSPAGATMLLGSGGGGSTAASSGGGSRGYGILQSLQASLGGAQGSYLFGGGGEAPPAASAAAAAGSPLSAAAASPAPASASSAASSPELLGNTGVGDVAVARIDNVLALLKAEQARKQRTWSVVWDETWALTKAKYMQTYIVDCIVWPPLQLINFTFVPLQLRVLYVNVANLVWNTYLSLQANGGH